ncbi:MAG: NADH-quinone oxidoreductase subunit M [Planctomycetes bacterium]|nr:NADH-quinone oxidoreductase subunit M [Planctomycetota bacterium]
MVNFPYLSFMTFTPVFGALFLLLIPKENARGIRTAAAFFTLLTLVISLFAWRAYDLTLDPAAHPVQLVEGKAYDPQAPDAERLSAGSAWIPAFHIYYFVGVDGLSLPLLLLTALISTVAVIASFNIENRVKEYFFFMLLLEAGMMGVFSALDFFLFYVFWEVMLVPMYFLIGVWGGPKKEFAAIKFFLYTLFGSVFMLVAMLALYFWSGHPDRGIPHTFNLLELKRQAGGFNPAFQLVVYWALFLGFAIKVPIFPFHTWLPLAHVEAPTAVSIILAAVLLKMGVYGFLRISFPILPLATQQYATVLLVLGFINVVYGAFCAMAQSDMKKLVAYSSINHMGYCLLGMASLSAIGLNGAIFEMLGHGFVTGSLFLLVGVVYDRAHHRDIDGFGGLGVRVPKYAGLMTLACMASLGLPGLCGFVGEFLCLLGAFNPNRILGNDATFKVFTALSVIGILVTAGFFLWMIQRVFLGKLNPKYAELPDLDGRETVAAIPLAVMTVLAGVFPWFLLKVMDPASQALVTHIVSHAQQVSTSGGDVVSWLR